MKRVLSVEGERESVYVCVCVCVCVHVFYYNSSWELFLLLYRLSIKQTGLSTKTRMRYPTQFRGS